MDGTLRADAARPLGAHVPDPVRLGDLGGLPEEGLEDNLGYILMFSAWAVGIVQAFLTRKPYLRRLDMIDDPALQAAQSAEERRAYARTLALRNPQFARDAGIGRRGGFDEGGVVDVNHAPVEDIADLPGDVVERLRGRVVCIPR
jgi:hypothetical protein